MSSTVPSCLPSLCRACASCRLERWCELPHSFRKAQANRATADHLGLAGWRMDGPLEFSDACCRLTSRLAWLRLWLAGLSFSQTASKGHFRSCPALVNCADKWACSGGMGNGETWEGGWATQGMGVGRNGSADCCEWAFRPASQELETGTEAEQRGRGWDGLNQMNAQDPDLKLGHGIFSSPALPTELSQLCY